MLQFFLCSFFFFFFFSSSFFFFFFFLIFVIGLFLFFFFHWIFLNFLFAHPEVLYHDPKSFFGCFYDRLGSKSRIWRALSSGEKSYYVVHSYADASRNIFNTIMTSGHSSLEKYTSQIIERVVSERGSWTLNRTAIY